MSILVGSLLIYHYDLEWWWYGIAIGLYVMEHYAKDLRYQHLNNQLLQLRALILQNKRYPGDE